MRDRETPRKGLPWESCGGRALCSNLPQTIFIIRGVREIMNHYVDKTALLHLLEDGEIDQFFGNHPGLDGLDKERSSAPAQRGHPNYARHPRGHGGLDLNIASQHRLYCSSGTGEIHACLWRDRRQSLFNVNRLELFERLEQPKQISYPLC